MQSGGCEDVGLSSHAPCLFVFFSLSICLSICLLSTLFLSVYYALDFSLTPSLRPPSGCSNELINHGCWCLAGLAVTKEVANKLLWRKGKKKKNGGRFCMPKATPWQTVIKCCSAKFYFFQFDGSEAGCVQPSLPQWGGSLHLRLFWISKFPDLCIINIALGLKGTEKFSVMKASLELVPTISDPRSRVYRAVRAIVF